nr:MAG TPA: hypothetical protein [Caudoviricetes sp.]
MPLWLIISYKSRLYYFQFSFNSLEFYCIHSR